MNTIKKLSLLLLAVISLYGCKEEDKPKPAVTSTFTVTIENVQTGKKFLNSGEISAIGPGDSQSISFNAGKGMYLSFANMFVQSNDIFFGFDDTGLALYDADGNATTGDVTSQISLWDAGTEVNEEPGVGPNQAPRQSGMNTGMDENGTIVLVSANGDGFTYPVLTDLIKVSLSHDGGTMFTVTFENTSAGTALGSPIAPGIWAIHNASAKLFEAGSTASAGLEGIAEDGNNSTMLMSVTSNSGYASPFAPGVWAVHDNTVNPIFDNNKVDKGEGLEALSEDGDPSGLVASLMGKASVSKSGVFNTPSSASTPGPLMGGDSYTFTFEAEEGDYLSFATMLIHANDLFFAFGEKGIALFNNGAAVSGDFTGQVDLWDAGTEVNEYPGAGNNQPARGGAGTGADENGNVQIVNDGFTYPAVNQLIKVTISK